MADKPLVQCPSCSGVAKCRCTDCKALSYCNEECQTKDWPTHKVTCQDARLEHFLERVAEIVQQAYLKFRELTWDSEIVKVEVKPKEIITYGSPFAPTLFIKFPDHLMPNMSVKKGVLCHLMCQEPSAFMENLILLLLRGLPVQIDEVQVIMKNIPRKSTAVFPDGTIQSNWPRYSHQILRLKSAKSGRMWYMDITGAQYGLHRALWLAKDFDSVYVQAISEDAFGTGKKILEFQFSKAEGRSILLYRKCCQAALRMNQAASKWTMRRGLRPRALVKLEGQAFEAKKLELLHVMACAVQDFVANSDFSYELRELSRNANRPRSIELRTLPSADVTPEELKRRYPGTHIIF